MTRVGSITCRHAQRAPEAFRDQPTPDDATPDEHAAAHDERKTVPAGAALARHPLHGPHHRCHEL